jgi:alpha-glucosidase
MQDHVYSKSRPENLAWLERMRALMDAYDARCLIGEVGDNALRSINLMAEYTRPGRLHMAYSFDMLGPQFTPAHFHSKIEGFFAKGPDSWPMWAFSNHDVVRHATRWADKGAGDDVARQAAALLLSLEGSICLYQGEELGQTETDLDLAELTDPPGIRFWPEYKGRDGCRTPMVWDDTAQAGFTTGRPWLPIKPPQAARHVAGQAGVTGSVLEFYRHMLAFRRATPALRAGRTQFLNLPDPILAFTRGEGLACVFNLSDQPQSLTAKGQMAAGPAYAAVLSGNRLTLGPNGFCWLSNSQGQLHISA